MTWNNPCFEYWHLLHFKQTSKYYRTFDALKKDLMVFLPDYDKSQKYYTKEHQDIFLKLKDHLRTAIKNARLLPGFDFDHPHKGLSEMHLIFEEEMDGVKIIDMIDV